MLTKQQRLTCGRCFKLKTMSKSVSEILEEAGVQVTSKNLETIANLHLRYNAFGHNISKEAIATYIATNFDKEKDNIKEIFNKLHYMKVSSVKKTAKVGRNNPCPCGSGKKYKKCCLNKKE